MHKPQARYANERPPGSPERPSFNWEHEVIANIASESLNEQRKARRWGVFFKILGFAYITGALLMVRGNFDFSFNAPEQHTAIVDVTGPKGILLTASDTSSIVSSVQQARDAGLVVIALDTPLDPIDSADMTFATDNFLAGELIGQ